MQVWRRSSCAELFFFLPLLMIVIVFRSYFPDIAIDCSHVSCRFHLIVLTIVMMFKSFLLIVIDYSHHVQLLFSTYSY